MENGKSIGLISQTAILSALLSCQRPLIAKISTTDSFIALKTLNGKLGQAALELRENTRSAALVVRALSELHRAIQRRCIELVLAEQHSVGQCDLPAPFALLIMGSGGRKEMLLNTDQDNAIILADSPAAATSTARTWFTKLSQQINQRLDQVGYAWCPGNIMACNPGFLKNLSEWREQLSHITALPTAQAARWATVFFDFDRLYGDASLTHALREHLLAELKAKPGLLKLMVEDDASNAPALGLFNRLITANDGERKGKIDLKRNGTRILTDAVRIYALSEGIHATNTADRLHALLERKCLDSVLVESVLAAHDTLLELTLSHQLRQLQNGQTLDKLLDIRDLTPVRRESLRMAMRLIKRLQDRLQAEFGALRL